MSRSTVAHCAMRKLAARHGLLRTIGLGRVTRSVLAADMTVRAIDRSLQNALIYRELLITP